MATTVNGIEDLPYADYRVREFYSEILEFLLDIERTEEYRKDDRKKQIEKLNETIENEEDKIKVPEGTNEMMITILDKARHQKGLLQKVTVPVIHSFVTATGKTGSEIASMSHPERIALMMTNYGPLQQAAMQAAFDFVKKVKPGVQ